MEDFEFVHNRPQETLAIFKNGWRRTPIECPVCVFESSLRNSLQTFIHRWKHPRCRSLPIDQRCRLWCGAALRKHHAPHSKARPSFLTCHVLEVLSPITISQIATFRLLSLKLYELKSKFPYFSFWIDQPPPSLRVSRILPFLSVR